jgi:hypothetical protein
VSGKPCYNPARLLTGHHTVKEKILYPFHKKNAWGTFLKWKQRIPNPISRLAM